MASRRGQAKAAAPRADRDGTAGPAADRIRTGLARVIPAGPSAGRAAPPGPVRDGSGRDRWWSGTGRRPGRAGLLTPRRSACRTAGRGRLRRMPCRTSILFPPECVPRRCPGIPRGKARSAGYAGLGGRRRRTWFRSCGAPGRVCSFQRAVLQRGNSCPGRVVAKGQVNAVARTAGIAVLDRSTAVRALPGHSSAASPLGAEPPQTRCPAVSIGHDWPEKQRQLMTFQGLR